MRLTDRSVFSATAVSVALVAALAAAPAGARAARQQGPVDLTTQAQPAPVPAPTVASPAPAAPPVASSAPVAIPPSNLLPPAPPVAQWTAADAKALLAAIKGIGTDGLLVRDYEPAALAAAIQKGEGPELDQLASRLFIWLAQDLRDGRTPMTARVQWFAVDPDQDIHPDSALLAQATETHDVAGVLESLKPTHPDYALLKDMLAKAKEPAQIAMIRANMDRWRWLARDLGLQYRMILLFTVRRSSCSGKPEIGRAHV